VIELTLPWPPRALSPNARTHHMALAKEKKAYRTHCGWLAREQGATQMGDGPKFVFITFYPRTRNWPDWDNCIASFKAGLDGIVDAIGVDDSQFRIGFEVKREVGGMVKVRIEDATA
jgi:crossover junction endodeoxyribonuclease RusA